MKFLRVQTGLVLLAAWGGNSTALGAEALGRLQQPVIYGQDDRLDVYEHPSEALRSIARNSVVALMSPRRVNFSEDGKVAVNGASLNEAYGLCEGQRFGEQPTAAFCSGVLIDDDLVATAGHCLGSSPAQAEEECANLAIVFGYLYESENELASLDWTDTYRCQRVVSWQHSLVGAQIDYAVIQLDRGTTAPMLPVSLASEGPREGEGVALIGFGTGLPAKIDSGGTIISAPEELESFAASVDAFGGSSGGPLLNEAGELLGLMSRGAIDWDFSSGCAAARTLTAGGELLQRASTAVTAVCDAGWPSQRLCGKASECGDGICSSLERDEFTCPSDCAPSVCGDGQCELAEPIDCPIDCDVGVEVPEEWTCNPEYFGDRLGCDCDCGALDIDCGIAGQRLLNCLGRASQCGEGGQCERRGTLGFDQQQEFQSLPEEDTEGVVDLQELLAKSAESTETNTDSSCAFSSPAPERGNRDAWWLFGVALVARSLRRQEDKFRAGAAKA